MIALVRKHGRKQHLAVTLPGTTVWETLGSCRLTIPVHDTVDFLPVEEAFGSVDSTDPSVCLHCLHLIGFAKILQRRPELLDGVPRRFTAVAS